MATHSSVLASRIPGMGSLVGCRLWSHTKLDMTQATSQQQHHENHQRGNGTPLQYSCLETPMDRGAWWAAAHGVTKSRTRLSDLTFTFHLHALEKEIVTHSRILA